MSTSWFKSALVVFALTVVGAAGYQYLERSTPVRAIVTSGIWFDDLQDPAALSDEEAERLMQTIASAVTGKEDMIEGTLVSDPEDQSPRIVFISANDTRTPAGIALGAGRGLETAVRNAVSGLRKLGLEGQPVHWWKLDVVNHISNDAATTPGQTPEIIPSLHGIAFVRSTELALLPTEVVANRAVDTDGRLRLENLPPSMQDRLVSKWRRLAASFSASRRRQMNEQTKFTGFSTEGFFFDGEHVVRLYRGQRLREAVTQEILMRAALRAGAYLQRSVRSNGKFDYSYLPAEDRVQKSYNLVRHAGTVYAMLELYEVDGNPELLDAARRAIDYLLGFVKDYDAGTQASSVLVSGDKIKLGGVALTVVALAKYTQVTQDREHLPVMRRLARYIQYSQNSDGSFVSQRYYPSRKIRKDFVSQYYPGEAILALLRLNALEPQSAWLDTAENAARYLITVRDGAVATHNLVHDHWLLYALNELYRVRSRELYLNHAMRIAQAITVRQNRRPRYPDHVGSYYVPPRSTPTAVRTEGLLAAHALALDFDRLQHTARIRAAIELGIGFQLQTQIGPEKAMYMKDPQRALGGFHRSLSDYEVRIDYVQHNLSAILGFYRLLRSEHNAAVSGSPGVTMGQFRSNATGAYAK